RGIATPVTRSVDGKNYQVSWTEDVAKASSGDKVVKVFDEEGYKKAQETGSLSSVSPLLTLTINHPGTYKGPIVPIEFLAVIIIVFVGFSAFSAKSKLTA